MSDEGGTVECLWGVKTKWGKQRLNEASKLDRHTFLLQHQEYGKAV